MNPMDRLTPITLGELIDEEFLQPLGVSQYRLNCAQVAHDTEVANAELAEAIEL
jgi:plasmid maintenance system antidote protein VapI